MEIEQNLKNYKRMTYPISSGYMTEYGIYIQNWFIWKNEKVESVILIPKPLLQLSPPIKV